MKPLASALPAGLSPEPKPSSGPPRPESAASAPGVCALCAEHWPEAFGWHYRVSERGSERLGPCSAPPKPRETKPEPNRVTRTHEEAMEILHAKANRASAVSVLGHETYSTHSQPPEREPGSDDE